MRSQKGASDGLCACGGADGVEPGVLGRPALQRARDVAHGPGHRRAAVAAARVVPVRWTVLGAVRACILGAAGGRPAGGATRAAASAMVGSLLGGLLGTAL